MLKKCLLLSIVICQLQAKNNSDPHVLEDQEPRVEYCSRRGPVLLEAKAAYYRPSDSFFRHVYGTGGIYGLELSVRAWHDLYAWTSASYFRKSGHSLGGRDKTSLFFVPVGVGLKYLFPVGNWDIYLAAGALGTYLHIRDHSPFVIPSSCKWGLGGIAKVGILWNIARYLFIDFFADYSYMRIHFHNTNHGSVTRKVANLSGLSAGGGFGFRF